jgi:beta-glucosidase/6-phospho-beta-glucosidase/beta-galactosidase
MMVMDREVGAGSIRLPQRRSPIFSSFVMAGFECSTHEDATRGRHDVLKETRHDIFALNDYRALTDIGIQTVREGLRWHLIEPRAGEYNFSSVVPMLEAARQAGVQTVWDLVHFGIPDGLDVFSSAFVERVAGLARAFTQVLVDFTPQPWLTPVNEISFLSFAAGHEGFFAPYHRDRGLEFKRQLVRASIAATDAAREIAPHLRLMQPEPVINIVPARANPDSADEAWGHNEAQFQAWDMLCGRLEPELGGGDGYLDVLGLNVYSNNQWERDLGVNAYRLDMSDPRWKPFSISAGEIWQRYRRPMIVSETGAEGAMRLPWLAYIASETLQVLQQGIPLEGLCLYPILDHAGWGDGRHVRCGLYGFRQRGTRYRHEVLTQELLHWQGRLKAARGSG